MKDAVVIVDPDVRINQQIVLGVSETLQRQEDWDIHVLPPQGSIPELLRHIEAVSPAAVVARSPRPGVLAYLMSVSAPLVVVAYEGRKAYETSVVIPDDEAIGRMAADYLLTQGFEHLAMIAFDRPAEDPRMEAFVHAVGRRGRTVSRYKLQVPSIADHPFSGYGDPAGLLEWLRELPKPCAVFAHSDQPAAYIIRTCVRNGIRVPEEVSVLGVDNDLLFCHTVTPNLASVHLPYRRIGIEAARMIQEWKPGRRLRQVLPTTVVERASCRPPRRGDPLVDMALDHLRTKVADGVRVRDLQKLTGLSPHQLVYRFNIVTGRTPMEMILLHRIAVAKQLLAETTDPVATAARQSGFNSATQFYVTFKAQVGMSPKAYREQFGA